MTITNYKELHIWQRGIDLAEKVYQITEAFPKREMYGMTNQMRRASYSIPTNIAEGWTRGKRDSVIHYLDIASGSISELETFIILSNKFKFLSEENKVELEKDLKELGKMIYRLKIHLSKK